ncbi:hypothetical protein QJQ45_018750 [Haematococcus lacustris]|nr:hypothetical protein QJQ45_018750 [Haematococcus lacustris]
MIAGTLSPGVRRDAGLPRSSAAPLRAHRRYANIVRPRAASEGKGPQEFGLAPAHPKTPYGEMLQYYLKMRPELFKGAVEDQLERLRTERDAREKEESSSQQGAADGSPVDSKELTLYKRMEEVRAREVRATLEDLMYVSILEKFMGLGVNMLPRMDGHVDVPATNLLALTEGLHSREALELVREHMLGVMGAAATATFSNATLKMSKFQMAQVYAASIMFGYFLRRVDKRFQLEKALGSLRVSKEDAVARLEQLFAAADAQDAPWDADDSSQKAAATADTASRASDTPASTSQSKTLSEGSSSSSTSANSIASSSSSSGAASSSRKDLPVKKEKGALRKYVESFDQATMVETARIVSTEGAALVERQTSALLGDIKVLAAQVQAAVGKDASSMEEVMERMAKAVESDAVETLLMTVATQRRAVLEAVAFGTFLRDVESWVDQEYSLLTPLPAPRLPPGRG